MEAAVAAAPDIDFSLSALFLRANWVVQIVMVGLLVMSFWSWAIMIDKWLKFRGIHRQIKEFQEVFWSGDSLDGLYERVGSEPDEPIERVFAAGLREWRRSFGKDGKQMPGGDQRIDRMLNVAVAREGDRATKGLGVLATVGSIAPFVGLFGTVWGIKNSFEAIAIQQNTNLAVVAPGIAEALVATALGLLAAIPAVIGYNKLAGEADVISGELENFSEEFATILSRQFERSAG